MFAEGEFQPRRIFLEASYILQPARWPDANLCNRDRRLQNTWQLCKMSVRRSKASQSRISQDNSPECKPPTINPIIHTFQALPAFLDVYGLIATVLGGCCSYVLIFPLRSTG